MSKQPKSNELAHALNRRQFLVAGGTLSAGAMLIRAHPAHASEEAAMVAHDCAPFQNEMDKEPPFDDEDFYDKAEMSCEKHTKVDEDLDDPDDRKCERILAKLWIAFARGAHAEKPFARIEDGAIHEGIFCIRGHIIPNPDAFPIDEHLKKWLLLGKYAAGKANGGTLTKGHFKFAWGQRDTYEGFKCRHKKIDKLQQRATELIGHHMWTMYTMGVLSYGGFDKDPVVSDDVITKGRIQSRSHVYRNVDLLGVAKHGDRGPQEPNYTKWHFHEVGCCAYICGRRAARAAKVNGKTKIGAPEFETGWCQTSWGFQVLGFRKGVLIRSAGCG